jgi:hypothetical protein
VSGQTEKGCTRWTLPLAECAYAASTGCLGSVFGRFISIKRQYLLAPSAAQSDFGGAPFCRKASEHVLSAQVQGLSYPLVLKNATFIRKPEADPLRCSQLEISSDDGIKFVPAGSVF